MKLDYNLNLSQEQKLVMTQNMQLSIKILQMSSLELNEYISKQLEENPILDSDINDKGDISNLEYKELIRESINSTSQYSQHEANEDSVSPLDFITEKKSLKSFLEEQVNCSREINDDIKRIVEYMIESLDERGYLDEDMYSICKSLNITEDMYQEALNFVQGLEPIGIGARSLGECLLIQLKRINVLDMNLQEIITNNLELIAENKYKKIAKLLNISDLEAQNYGDIIKKLEPKPSRGFYTGDEVKFITPDACIRKLDGEYLVLMNNDIVPKLTLNNVYKNLILNGNDKAAEEYLKEKINSAVFLIKSINNRENTLKKILEEIVKRQHKYFEDGRRYLKPMTLKDIAESVDMHESTVSRAIKDKYILTNYGTVKIKELFTNGFSNGKHTEAVEDGQLSTNSIKEIIKQIIYNEDKKKPLSDELISIELSKKNLHISRRTVAKYREEMEIKSSSKRKRL